MSSPYVGEIRMFAGNFAPAGWAFCDGTLLAIADYDTLFNLIGTTYGGDGQTTFALPDLRSRVPAHQGNGLTLAHGVQAPYNRGGAIWNRGTLNVTNSTLSNNNASTGKAIYNDYGTLTVTGTTATIDLVGANPTLTLNGVSLSGTGKLILPDGSTTTLLGTISNTSTMAAANGVGCATRMSLRWAGRAPGFFIPTPRDCWCRCERMRPIF